MTNLRSTLPTQSISIYLRMATNNNNISDDPKAIREDSTMFNPSAGSRVLVQDDKGVRWRATIIEKRSNGFQIHYDGHKKNSTYYVPSEKIAGPLFSSRPSKDQLVQMVGKIENLMEEDVCYQSISGSWSFDNEVPQPFQLARVVPPTEDLSGLLEGVFIFDGSFKFGHRQITEKGIRIKFRHDKRNKGVVYVDGRGVNEIGTFKLMESPKEMK